MKNYLKSYKLLGFLLTTVILIALLPNIYSFYHLFVEIFPWVNWLGLPFLAFCTWFFSDYVGGFLETAIANQREIYKQNRQIIENARLTPEKVDKNIVDIAFLNRQMDALGERVERAEVHLSILSPETLLSSFANIADNLGLLRQNMYQGEFDGKTVGCIVILSNAQYKEFILKETKTLAILGLTETIAMDNKADGYTK
jgi:hypothetical protein